MERGAVASHETLLPCELARFKARVFWMGSEPLRPGRVYRLKLATQEADVQVESFERVFDASTLDSVSFAPGKEQLSRHEVGELRLNSKRPVVFDPCEEIIPMGRFVLMDDSRVAGGGIIIGDSYPRRTSGSHYRSENIYWSRGAVTSEQRAARNNHHGLVIWLTGLSGVGKSTIATDLERELFSQLKHVYILDGDNMRHGLCTDLGFSPADRRENIRRIGEVARLFADAGFICITAFISPYRADRELVRSIISAGRFIEVYLNAPLEVCEKRDPKGLYAKARAGEIKEFTGVSAPYEPPVSPEIELLTDKLTPADCVSRILEFLKLKRLEVSIQGLCGAGKPQ